LQNGKPLAASLPRPVSKQKRLEALRKDMPSDVDVSIDPTVSNSSMSPAENQYALRALG